MVTINLENVLKDKVDLAVVQLKSPFYDEMEVIEQEGDRKDAFYWKKGVIDKRGKKIQDILEEIIQKREHIGLIVFPEYSIPGKLVSNLKDFADKNNVIIIAGSDQMREENENYRKNLCPVIIPKDKIYYVEKQHISDLENGILESGDDNASVLNFTWSHNNENFAMSVVLCLDYLKYYNTEKIEKEKKGMIIVPMCTNNLSDYFPNIYVRMGKFVIFCNAVDMDINKKERILGRSSIYGSKEERDEIGAIISTNDKKEAVLMAELNVANPIDGRPKQLDDGGVVRSSSKEREYNIIYNKITKSYNLDLSSTIKNEPGEKAAIINPNIYKDSMGKILQFAFLGTKKYRAMRSLLKNNYSKKSDAFGIIGNYDGIMLHFLDAKDASNLEKTFRNNNVIEKIDSLEVKRVLKFYNYPVPELSEGQRTSLMEPLIRKKLIHLSKDWNTLKNEGEINDFFDKKLILGEYERIDMKNDGYIRAFFCLSLVEGDKADLFEKEIINECVSNEKYKNIQSIYKTKGFANLTWHYVLDIVALPHKLFNTLIKIYKKSEEFDIDITSNTYIVVEHLTQGMFTGPIEELIDVDNVNEEDLSIDDLIEKGESSRIEFKSSLKWDYKAQSAIKEREFDVLRTIAGFANSEGGYLLVGIRDNKDILGIEKDFQTLGRKKDIDGFELHLLDIIKERLGTSALILLNIVFEKIEGKTLCKLKVRPSYSNMPIYLSRNKQDEFFVRMGNSTKQLGLKETLDYLRRRFPDA